MTHTRSVPLDVLLAHRPFVVGLANALVHDPGTAADIEQEAWLAALRRPPAPGGSARGWFARVLRNEVRDTRRAATRRTRRERVAARRESLPSTSDCVERRELHRRVVAAVHMLAEPYRSTVYMRFFDGCTTAEIAEHHGASKAAVRKRLERALAQLRERLDDEHDGDRAAWLGGLVLIAADNRASPPLPGLMARSLAAVCACAVVVALGWAWFASDVSPTSAALRRIRAPVAAAVPVVPPPDVGEELAAPSVEPAAAPLPTRANDERVVAVDDAAESVVETGFTISVVDEQGTPLRSGTLRIETEVKRDASSAVDAIAATIPTEVDLATANPLRLDGLRRATEHVRLRAQAFPTGRPPTDDDWCYLVVDEVVAVELVAPLARSLTVRVLGPEGDTPVAGATVISATEAWRRGLRSENLRGVSGPASAITGDDGRAVLEQLGGGRHGLVVRTPGRRTARTDVGDETELTIRIPAGDTGTVIARCNWFDGSPNTGSTVFIRDERVLVGEDGTSRFEDIGVGRHTLILFEQGIRMAGFGEAPAVRNGAWVGYPGFELAAGETIEVGVGYVEGDAALELEFVDASGAPRLGVHVELSEPGERTADCDADGIVRFRKLPPGDLRYDVITRRDGLRWRRYAAPLEPGESRRERVLIGSAVVEGTIASAAGVPPRKTEVELTSAGRTASVTSRDGRFTFEDVPPGPAWLIATARRRQSYPVLVEVGTTSPLEPRLEVLPYGRVAFEGEGVFTALLRDARGSETLLVKDGEPRLRRQVTQDGPLVVSSPVPPGRYELERTMSDGATRSVSVDIDSGGRSLAPSE